MPKADKNVEELVRDSQLQLIILLRQLRSCSPAEELEIRGGIKRILVSLGSSCDTHERAFVNCVGFQLRYSMNNLSRKELEKEILKFVEEIEHLIS